MPVRAEHLPCSGEAEQLQLKVEHLPLCGEAEHLPLKAEHLPLCGEAEQLPVKAEHLPLCDEAEQLPLCGEAEQSPLKVEQPSLYASVESEASEAGKVVQNQQVKSDVAKSRGAIDLLQLKSCERLFVSVVRDQHVLTNSYQQGSILDILVNKTGIKKSIAYVD